MSDHAALLAAICESPGEDTPRLAFADYLDEHADTPADRDRARFIRDDVAASALAECDPTRLRWELIEKPRREAEGWVSAAFALELRLPPRSVGPLRRGFPWSIRMEPVQFLTNAGRVLAQVPGGVLVFASPNHEWAAFTRSPHLARLSGLHMRQAALGPDAVRQLAESPHALAIEWLSAGHDGLTHAALPALLRSPLFARLTKLDLDGRPWVGGSFATNFAQIGGRVRLRELSLAEAGVTGEHLQRLLTSVPADGLERLGLKGNRIGVAGHEALARLPLDNLRKLDLSETTPGVEGFHALMTSLTLSRLERLGYRKNHVNGAMLAELATCHEVRNLRVLDLAENAVGNAGAVAVARSPHFAGLLYLNLSYGMVGDEGVLALLESPLADTLVLLNLTGSPASADTLELLKARMGDRVRL